MTSVLKQRNFALLWIGQVISMIGDWVLIVALPFYIYNITGRVEASKRVDWLKLWHEWQKNVADEYRGRVFGSFGTTNALLVLVGMGLASVLGSIFSVSLLLTLAGCLFIVSALLFTRMPDIPIPVQEYAG